MTYWLWKDSRGQYRWYLEAANGKKIAEGGESYYNRQDAINAVNMVMDTTRQTPFKEK